MSKDMVRLWGDGSFHWKDEGNAQSLFTPNTQKTRVRNTKRAGEKNVFSLVSLTKQSCVTPPK